MPSHLVVILKKRHVLLFFLCNEGCFCAVLDVQVEFAWVIKLFGLCLCRRAVGDKKAE